MSVSEPTVGAATVPLVAALCAGLSAAGVRFCHFKSNAALDRTRRAENDLDLLVHRADAAAFAETLDGLGFKLAHAHRRRAVPGVVDYYGHEPAAAKLVHVHAHFQLVVGDDRTKSHRVPLEDAFLQEARPDGEFPVPPPELELLLLVIRLMVKHASWDAYALRLHRIRASARGELDDLRARVDVERLHAQRERWLPQLSRELFDTCLSALAPRARPAHRIRAATRLLAVLAPYARRGRAHDVALKAWRRVDERLRPVPRRRPAAGGAVIAFVGADGAGKSTAIDAVEQWLARTFVTHRLHLGRPAPSATTRALVYSVHGPPALLRRLGLLEREPRLPPAVLGVALARDRARLARRARRLASAGALVICDRYPLPQLTLMDAPRVARTYGTGRLSALEQRFYDRVGAPDVLLVLLVDAELAIARKPEEDPDWLRARWAAMWAVDWAATGAHVIDAGQPAATVLEQIKSVIWSEV